MNTLLNASVGPFKQTFVFQRVRTITICAADFRPQETHERLRSEMGRS